MDTNWAEWVEISDDKIRHIWNPDKGCIEDPTCEVETTIVSPTFYQDNGTPCCGCGTDMIYSHSELEVL
jgi:hypothetical protein